jgi:hypothetical protein
MEEPAGRPEGKTACCTYEEQFLNNLEAFHSMEIKAIAGALRKVKSL